MQLVCRRTVPLGKGTRVELNIQIAWPATPVIRGVHFTWHMHIREYRSSGFLYDALLCDGEAEEYLMTC